MLTEDTHTFDHVIPRSKKGTNEKSNLVDSCQRCNLAKGSDDLAVFLAKIGKKHFEHKGVTAIYTPMTEPKVYDPFEHYGLPGKVVKGANGKLTYTPPQGTGITKILRKILKQKHVEIVWAPLPAPQLTQMELDQNAARLKALRTRWQRWLGQKLRLDLPFYTDLFDANFKGWPRKVLGRDQAAHEDFGGHWRAAIAAADLDQLRSLDCINLDFNSTRKTRKK
jgi:hypothetical protein